MGGPISWLSPAAMQVLGWALIHFVWQGAAIAGLAAAVMGFCRRPGTRYVIGVGALALMTAMPVVTFLLFDHSVPRPPSLAVRAAFSVFDSFPRTLLPWLVQGWFAGVALLSLRFAGGYILLEQKGRQQSTAAAANLLALCREVQQRLGIHRAIRYLECGWLQVPAVIGFMRPMILLPVAALAGLTEAQLRAVIAHELAHVRRWDFLVNLFQILAETLLFYHPAIWWLNRRISAERELCCDEIAMAEAGGRIEYAHALVLMAKLGSAPGLAMAATHGILSERIFHILGLPRAKPRIAGLAGSVVLLTASLGVAAVLTGVPDFPAHNNARVVAAAASGESLAVPRPNDDDYVMQRRVARIRTIKTPRISSISVLLPIVSVEVDSPPAPVDPLVVPAPQTDTPAHPRSIVAQELDTQLPLDNDFPAPVLKLNASYGLGEWTEGETINYCKEFAVQTVTQRANRTMAVDDGVKQRLSFFYWHCMRSNAGGTIRAYGDGGGWGTSPAYVALGPASPGHPANVSGNWAIAFPSPLPYVMALSAETRSCSFTQTGNTLSGICMGRDGSGTVAGVIDGRQVRWSWKLPLDDGRREGEFDFIATVGPDGAMTGQSIREGNLLESFKATPSSAQVASQK